jgi:hypothetical protein
VVPTERREKGRNVTDTVSVPATFQQSVRRRAVYTTSAITSAALGRMGLGRPLMS